MRKADWGRSRGWGVACADDVQMYRCTDDVILGVGRVVEAVDSKVNRVCTFLFLCWGKQWFYDWHRGRNTSVSKPRQSTSRVL